jgi:L-fucose mutarotase
MLFNIPPSLPAELIYVLARMGHGDDIAIVDSNYPAFSDAHSTYLAKPIDLPGRDLIEAMTDILSLLPLDTFDKTPVQIMASPGGTPSVHRDAEKVLATVPGAPWSAHPLERFAFYEQVKTAFAVVRTVERRPYGNVILKAGVIAPNGQLMTPEFAAAAD